jgi:hypothetical protein
LAAAISAERAFERLPVLADALEEAGCADADILGHLRGPRPHGLGCWVVDGLLGLAPDQPVKPKLTREEMVAFVEGITAADGSEAEIDELIETFEANCLHPGKTVLIFWPHGFPHDPSKPEPTAAEIVDKAMSGEG